MKDRNLLLVGNGSAITPFVVSSQLADRIRRESTILIGDNNYVNHGTCCEWIEAVQTESGGFLGVCLVDFYEPGGDAVQGLRVDNVIWKSSDEAVFLLDPTKLWKMAGGPYLPAFFLKSKLGSYCYLLPEAFPDSPYRIEEL